MTGIMSLVNDKDNIWDLIGNEESFKDGKSGLLKNDLLSLEKSQLKQDFLFLDKIISFSKEGKMSVKMDGNDHIQFSKMLRRNEYLENSSSTSSSDSDGQRSNLSNQVRFNFLKGKEEREKSVSSYNQGADQSPRGKQVEAAINDKLSDAIASYGSMKAEQEDHEDSTNQLSEVVNDSESNHEKQISLQLDGQLSQISGMNNSAVPSLGKRGHAISIQIQNSASAFDQTVS